MVAGCEPVGIVVTLKSEVRIDVESPPNRRSELPPTPLLPGRGEPPERNRAISRRRLANGPPPCRDEPLPPREEGTFFGIYPGRGKPRSHRSLRAGGNTQRFLGTRVLLGERTEFSKRKAEGEGRPWRIEQGTGRGRKTGSQRSRLTAKPLTLSFSLSLSLFMYYFSLLSLSLSVFLFQFSLSPK